MAHSCMPCVFLLITLAIFSHRISARKDIPIFIFGDSSADVGTNNYVPGCEFSCNHAPYGMNYHEKKSTGRWSDGYNTIDFLSAKLTNLEESPKPYLALNLDDDPDFTKGANFASAGSGLLCTTGNKIHTMSEQVEQFISVRKNLKARLRYSHEDEIHSWISNAIFVLSIGSNDIIEYQLTSKDWTDQISKKLIDQTYHIELIDRYIDFMKKLYEHGARKFGVISALAMGCCPGLRVEGHCSDVHNKISKEFVSDLKEQLEYLQEEYTDLKYSLGDTYSMMMNVMLGKSTIGLTNVAKACCEQGCANATVPVCANPKEYAFWDDYHPTEAASEAMANVLYNGKTSDAGEKYVTPITFQELFEGENTDDDDLLKFNPKIRHIYFRQ